MAGLLDLSSFKLASPPTGLFGSYYNPAEERKAKIYGAMTQAGLGLLQGGQGNFGQVLGQGMAGAAQGAQQAGQNYRNDALTYSQMGQQQQDRQRKIGMENKEISDKENEVAGIMDFLHTQPPEVQAAIGKDNVLGAKLYQEYKIKSMFDGGQKQPRPATAEEKAAYGVKPESPMYFGEDGMPKILTDGKLVNIDMGQGEIGPIPGGWEVFTDPATNQRTMREIKGGPAYLEKQAASDVGAARESKQATLTDTIISAASKARNIIGPLSTGTIGRGMSYLGETDAAELYRQTEVLKSTAKIENLNAMRQESKTGAALGAVTIPELEMLASRSGALDPSAGPERFQKALDDYELTLFRVVHGYVAGTEMFKKTRQKDNFGSSGGIGSEIDSLVEQYRSK